MSKITDCIPQKAKDASKKVEVQEGFDICSGYSLFCKRKNERAEVLMMGAADGWDAEKGFS